MYRINLLTNISRGTKRASNERFFAPAPITMVRVGRRVHREVIVSLVKTGAVMVALGGLVCFIFFS